MTDLLTAAEARKVAEVRSPKTWNTLVGKGEISVATTVTDDYGRVTPRFARADVEALADKRELRGISVFQPWASEIVARTKRYEYRGWALRTTPRRLILCAAALKPKDPAHQHLPRGVVLAEITVAKCIPMKEGSRYAWLISKVVPLEPVPVKGGQKIFRLKPSTQLRPVLLKIH